MRLKCVRIFLFLFFMKILGSYKCKTEFDSSHPEAVVGYACCSPGWWCLLTGRVVRRRRVRCLRLEDNKSTFPPCPNRRKTWILHCLLSSFLCFFGCLRSVTTPVVPTGIIIISVLKCDFPRQYFRVLQWAMFGFLTK